MTTRRTVLRSMLLVAALAGRDHVLPDDVKRLCPWLLYHRVILGAGVVILLVSRGLRSWIGDAK